MSEIAITKRGETITPYVYTSVEYDTPIDPARFTEEMPKTPKPPPGPAP